MAFDPDFDLTKDFNEMFTGKKKKKSKEKEEEPVEEKEDEF